MESFSCSAVWCLSVSVIAEQCMGQIIFNKGCRVTALLGSTVMVKVVEGLLGRLTAMVHSCDA